MKKTISILTIFIVLMLLAFMLEVQVPVMAKIGGREQVELNKKTLRFVINSPKDFNSVGINFISFNRPVGGKITFLIYDNAYSNKKKLVKHVFDRGGLPQGDYYKFRFKTLKARKNYYLRIKGENGVPYRLLYDKNTTDSNNKEIDGILSHKLYIKKPIAYVVLKASQRAARDWFKLGPLYLISIIAYILFVSVLIGGLIWRWELEEK